MLIMRNEILNAIGMLFGSQREATPGYHIFYRLMNDIEEDIGQTERMRMMWIFSMTEKSLKEARKRSVNYARFFLEEVERDSTAEIDLVYHARNFVYLPARAFYEYHCLQEYDKAIESLLASMQSIDYIVRTGRLEMMGAAVEQYINICRVLLKKGRTQEAMKEFGNLLCFLFSGRSETGYYRFDQRVPRLSYSERLRDQWIDYATNIVLEKYRNVDCSSQQACLEMLFRWFPLGEMPDDDVYAALYGRCVRLIRSRDAEEWRRALLEECAATLPDIYRVPGLMQYFVLLRLEEIYGTIYGPDEQISAAIKQYCVERLGLEYIYAGRQAGPADTLSPVRRVTEQEVYV